MGDNSPRTDTSTDLEGDAKLDDGHHLNTGGSLTSDHDHEAGTKNGDSKVRAARFETSIVFMA